MHVLRAASAYFGMVFGAGFIFGVLRTLWVAPLVGVRIAALMEAPLTLGVTVDPVADTVYLLMLGTFAAMPLLMGKA